MDKKYQVFVSSTYRDLQQERQEVMQALLELDCIPVGMELFPAANEDQWTLIKKLIDDCDYYVLIIGGRYGSVNSDGISFTQMEYEYTVDKKIPIISFLPKYPDKMTKDRIDLEPILQEKLEKFKSLAQKKMCKYWESPSDLGSQVSRSLVKLIKTNPRVGWVKADLVPDESTVSEIVKLRNTIEGLENQLHRLKTEAPLGSESLAQGNSKYEVNYSFIVSEKKISVFDIRPNIFNDNDQNYQSKCELTWDEIFFQLSPLMIDESNEDELKSSLNSMLASKNQRLHSDKYKNKDVHSYSIFSNDFQTIKVQLRALGLIVQSQKKRGIKDTLTYWSLTPYGDNIMNRLRAIKL